MIGNGNVATDVARMLALTRASSRAPTPPPRDRPLAECGVREIVILGRRGPVQAAFTNPELRELGEMEDADVDVDPAELELDPTATPIWSPTTRTSPPGETSRSCTEFAQREPEGKPKRIALRFLRSPIEIQGDGKVESLVVARNELYRDESGAIRARDTGERETIECGLVMRSIGYAGIGLDGVPFDPRRGLIPNEDGRVTEPSRAAAPRASTPSAGSSAARPG